MTRIFLKLYGYLLLAFLGIASVSFLVVQSVNQHRGEFHHQKLGQGAVSLIARNMYYLDEIERARWLDELNQRFNLSAAIFSEHSFSFNRRERERLDGGLSVVAHRSDKKTDNPFIVLKPANAPYLVAADLSKTIADIEHLSVYLLQYLSTQQPDHQTFLHLARQNFNFPLAMTSLDDLAFNQRQLASAKAGELVYLFEKKLDRVVLVSRLLDSEDYLLIGPIEGFVAYPLSLVSVVLVFEVGLLALVAYMLGRPIERRLIDLAGAARAIKKGNLDVRANVAHVDAIGLVATAFNAMAEHIQILLDMQNEMIRAVSHELRTPVARLRFGIQMIEDAESAGMRDQFLQGMDGDIDELDTLIDEILTYARLEQSAPEPEFALIDVDGIMVRVLSEMNAAAVKANVEMEHIPESLPLSHRLVEGEARYLHRVLQNFVGNAIRYAESRVRMSFLVDGVHCKIVVEDDGPGIPEGERAAVFAPFSRLDTSRNRSSGGYGLGLSIVKRIAGWHYGTVSISQSDLGGAAFVMEWPVRQPSPKPPSSNHESGMT